jgi:hypothetical protein
MAVPGSIVLGVFHLKTSPTGVANVFSALAHDATGSALTGEFRSVFFPIRLSVAFFIVGELLFIRLRVFGVEVCGRSFLCGHYFFFLAGRKRSVAPLNDFFLVGEALPAYSLTTLPVDLRRERFLALDKGKAITACSFL